MKKLIFCFFMSVSCLWLSGCATTLPTNSYIPQNYVRIDGSANIGEFTYLSFINGDVKKPNQIKSTALGSMFLSVDVASFTKRVNALELEKSGIKLDVKSKYKLIGEIITFEADDIGYSVRWSYSIKYKFIDKITGKTAFEKICTPEIIKTGKFGLPMDYATTIGELILAGYDIFIIDPTVIKFLTGTWGKKDI